MELSTILALIQEGGDAATQQEAPKNNPMMMIFWVVIIVLFIWMLFIKPMKDQKKRKEQLAKLEKGAKVITSSGIYGRIREVKENAFVIEIADGVKITVDKSCVYPQTENEEPGKDQK